MSTFFGRAVAACLVAGVIGALTPAGAVAQSDHYFSGSRSSGYGYASGSAHTYSYFTDGQADHNAFCASWISGVGGSFSSPANGSLWPYPVSCSTSGGFASVNWPGGVSSGYLHGAIWTQYGYGFGWNFTSETHYSW